MLKKIFIVTPRGTVSDILITIAKAIIFSIILDRDLFFDGYEKDCKNNVLLNIYDVVDIEKIQNFLNKLNVNTIILYNLNNYIDNYNSNDNDNNNYNDNNILKYEYTEYNIDNFYDLMYNSSYTGHEIINIGTLNNINIPEKITNANNLYYEVLDIIDFTEYYKNKSEYIKNAIYPENYISFYLTLTDKSINDFSYYFNLPIYEINTIYKNKYLKIINDTCDSEDGYKGKLYISTQVIASNVNYDFYMELKNKYNFIDKYNFISNEEYMKYGNSNDVIDYIISKDAEFFIGNQLTSFSILMDNYFKKNSKYSKLI